MNIFEEMGIRLETIASPAERRMAMEAISRVDAHGINAYDKATILRLLGTPEADAAVEAARANLKLAQVTGIGRQGQGATSAWWEAEKAARGGGGTASRIASGIGKALPIAAKVGSKALGAAGVAAEVIWPSASTSATDTTPFNAGPIKPGIIPEDKEAQKQMLRDAFKEHDDKFLGGGGRFSGGGNVWGAGSATSDSIPAWLSNGEFVHKADAVDYYGADFMHAVNEKRLPKFDTGGPVGMTKSGGSAWLAQQLAAAGLSPAEIEGVLALNHVEGGDKLPQSLLGFFEGQQWPGDPGLGSATGPEGHLRFFLKQWNDMSRRPANGLIPGTDAAGNVRSWGQFTNWMREEIVGQVGNPSDFQGNAQPSARDYQNRLDKSVLQEAFGVLPRFAGGGLAETVMPDYSDDGSGLGNSRFPGTALDHGRWQFWFDSPSRYDVPPSGHDDAPRLPL